MKSLHTFVVYALLAWLTAVQATVEKCEDKASKRMLGAPRCVDSANGEAFGPLNVCLKKKLGITLDDVKERKTTEQVQY